MVTLKDLEAADALVRAAETDGEGAPNVIEDGYVRCRVIGAVALMRAEMRLGEAKWLRVFENYHAEMLLQIKARLAELEAP